MNDMKPEPEKNACEELKREDRDNCRSAIQEEQRWIGNQVEWLRGIPKEKLKEQREGVLAYAKGVLYEWLLRISPEESPPAENECACPH
jgi:hypothetical protein